MLRFLRDQRGPAAVELALLLPLLILVLLGAIDLGRFGFYAVSVANAARTGAAFCDYAGCNLTGDTLDAIKDQVVFEAAPYVTLNRSLITLGQDTSTPGCPCLLVRVPYQFFTLIPWPGLPPSFWIGHQAMIPMGIQGS